MNVLEYIDELMEQGYTEEEAESMADVMCMVEYEPEEIW